MKLRLQAASTLVLIALVLSFVPAAALPSSASAAACFHAQFVADVTVPDGTRYDPNTTFKKTWRLRNIGECAWNGVTMIFDSGTQMGAPASVPVTSGIVPGQTVDVSLDMTAPATAGHYIGYWKFKSEQGTPFGIGVNANRAWWAEINVTGSSQGGVVLDFTADAGKATWSSAAGGLTFPGTDGDTRGFALTGSNFMFEDNTSPQSPILAGPQNITNGYIQGVYPDFQVQTGDVFKTQAGCELQARNCYVQFSLAYQIGSDPRITTLWRFNEKWDARIRPADFVYPDIRLDDPRFGLVGKNVKFILVVSALGSPAGDRALWGNPVIVRRGSSPPPTVTGTPPTPTATSTPGPIPPTVPPSSCDRVQFVRDVTVPDGTVMSPGATFTKTWRLKNVGACAWTKSYQLVFFSGQQMGAGSSAPFPQDVPVGQTIDISINMTAPSAAGSYRGFWMFKNASGALFGIGRQANQPWWVDIRVSGPTVTPGGPTVTPGGPTVTPAAGIAYDFATNACAATWFSGAGQLPCPGADGDTKGFVLKVSNPKLETGATDTRPGLVTFPQNIQNGYIQGFFPPFTVQNGDRFRSIINCEGGANLCYASFRLDYQTGTEPIRTLFGPFLERYEGQYYSMDVNLSALAGRNVKFILTVLSAGTATGDRALWVGPHIYRPGGGGSTLPDLTISQMRIEFQNTSCMEQGAQMGTRVWVTNNGQAAAGNFVVKVNNVDQTVNGLAVGETKPVFFAGYSNPVTAVVDPGGAIAESNEQNNTRSEQLPVPTAPLPCTGTSTPTATPTATSATVVPSATPTPTSATVAPTATPTATATATTSAANVYQNTTYNFKFNLPPGASIVSQSPNIGRVTLPIVTAGTNLLNKYIQIHVVENANPCVSPAVDGVPTSTENVTINAIPFVKTTGQGAAAGNRYDWTAYATTNNNACISLAFILHSVNPGNYATPPPVYDMATETAVIGTTMSTYSKIS